MSDDQELRDGIDRLVAMGLAEWVDDDNVRLTPAGLVAGMIADRVIEGRESLPTSEGGV